MPTASARVHLLLIEDDPDVVKTIRDGLDPEKYTLHYAATVAGGREQLRTRGYDAVILDLALPDGSGFELADLLRDGGSDVPILMLTAQSSVDHRIEGFGHGADDYLCKPFAVEELAARLDAVLRRARPERQHVLRYAGVELDLLKRVVHREGSQVVLSDRETDLLAHLMRHPEKVFPRAKLLEEVWSDDTETDSNVLNVYVNYLRNKLEAGGRYTRLIHTVRGVGYVLSEGTTDEVS